MHDNEAKRSRQMRYGSLGQVLQTKRKSGSRRLENDVDAGKVGDNEKNDGGSYRTKKDFSSYITSTLGFFGLLGSLEPLCADQLVAPLLSQLGVFLYSAVDTFLGGLGGQRVGLVECSVARRGACGGRRQYSVRVLVLVRVSVARVCSGRGGGSLSGQTGAGAQGAFLHVGYVSLVRRNELCVCSGVSCMDNGCVSVWRRSKRDSFVQVERPWEKSGSRHVDHVRAFCT